MATDNLPPKRQGENDTQVEQPIVTPQTQADIWQRIAMQLTLEVPQHKKSITIELGISIIQIT